MSDLDWWSDTVPLPLGLSDTERQAVQRNALGNVSVWEDILAMYEKLATHRMLPNQDPWSVRAAWQAGVMPPVLSTEHPFPIRYASHVWEQLHPISEPLRRLYEADRPERQTIYLTPSRARTRR